MATGSSNRQQQESRANDSGNRYQQQAIAIGSSNRQSQSTMYVFPLPVAITYCYYLLPLQTLLVAMLAQSDLLASFALREALHRDAPRDALMSPSQKRARDELWEETETKKWRVGGWMPTYTTIWRWTWDPDMQRQQQQQQHPQAESTQQSSAAAASAGASLQQQSEELRAPEVSAQACGEEETSSEAPYFQR